MARPYSRLLAPVLLVAILAAGCGTEEPEQPNLREQAREATVTPAEILEAPQNSPERTVLQWWRLTQFRSPDATDLFTPEAALALEEAGYERLSFRYLGPWLATVRPEIDEIDVDGDTANVFVALSGPRYLSPTKATLKLEQSDGKWLLSDATFILGQARLLEEQEKATLAPQGG